MDAAVVILEARIRRGLSRREHARRAGTAFPPKVTARVLATLPSGVDVTEQTTQELNAVWQCRLYFEEIPVDLFLDTTGFPINLHLHVDHHEIGGRKLPFLSCDDLAVSKCFFARRKDWVDLKEMLKAGRCDVAYVTGILTEFLGADDERIASLLALRDEVQNAQDSSSWSDLILDGDCVLPG